VLPWHGAGTAIRATPAALVQGRYREISRIAACMFVRKFQMITLGYKVRLLSFLLSHPSNDLPPKIFIGSSDI
jgi:hypothetical protein